MLFTAQVRQVHGSPTETHCIPVRQRCRDPRITYTILPTQSGTGGQSHHVCSTCGACGATTSGPHGGLTKNAADVAKETARGAREAPGSKRGLLPQQDGYTKRRFFLSNPHDGTIQFGGEHPRLPQGQRRGTPQQITRAARQAFALELAAARTLAPTERGLSETDMAPMPVAMSAPRPKSLSLPPTPVLRAWEFANTGMRLSRAAERSFARLGTLATSCPVGMREGRPPCHPATRSAGATRSTDQQARQDQQVRPDRRVHCPASIERRPCVPTTALGVHWLLFPLHGSLSLRDG